MIRTIVLFAVVVLAFLVYWTIDGIGELLGS